MERLQKTLAAAGVGSRRACEAWIREGRVRVNGQVVTELGTKVDPQADTITFDGRPVALPKKRYYIALNKPRGVVSTRADVHAARVVTDLVDLQGRPLLRPVGRLDADTEGLIFLTDDGEFLHRLTHPRHHVPKTYRAVVEGIPDADALVRLAGGVRLDDGMTAPAEGVRLVRANRPRPGQDGAGAGEGTAEVELTIYEGRNRQVRRMLAAVGHPVARLTRIRIGAVRLSGLPPGAWRHLTAKEVEDLTHYQEKHASWPTAPSPSRPPRAPSPPGSSRPKRPS
ncbi:MAG: rRNA pseudouridine synthase [Armatimonadetes bacterium]|nr:rRNA pseudouridine synthase [Armatimonadota bacterium]